MDPGNSKSKPYISEQVICPLVAWKECKLVSYTDSALSRDIDVASHRPYTSRRGIWLFTSTFITVLLFYPFVPHYVPFSADMFVSNVRNGKVVSDT